MRVLFFNYEYPPLGGGAANATSYILREFAKIPDLKVDLVTSSIDDAYHIENVSEDVIVHRLPIGKNKKNLHFQSQKDLLVYSWKAYFYAWKLARKNKYELTHSFFSVPCGFLSLVFKFQFGLPYIVSLRGADVPGYSDRFGMIYKILTPIIRYIWKKSDAVVSNSEGLKGLALEAKPNQKIDVIYNGIDIGEFAPRPTGDMDVFKILCVSRLTKRKGVEYLISAVAEIVEKNLLQVELVIAGDGDDSKRLKKIVSDLNIDNYVKFLGLVPHNELSAVYNSASMFVLPSLNEGMSNTMLEALASGLPIVATDTGGTKELVSDGVNGFIVKMQDSEDLRVKIEAILSDDLLREKMAEKSRAQAEEMSWKHVAEKYFDLYKKIKK